MQRKRPRETPAEYAERMVSMHDAALKVIDAQIKDLKQLRVYRLGLRATSQAAIDAGPPTKDNDNAKIHDTGSPSD